jgi:hypothetical protein
VRAQKYRAWEHHLALTVLASWFVAQTKFEWAQDYSRDPALLGQFKTDVLPALSVANVRKLLRAVMPLKHRELLLFPLPRYPYLSRTDVIYQIVSIDPEKQLAYIM